MKSHRTAVGLEQPQHEARTIPHPDRRRAGWTCAAGSGSRRSRPPTRSGRRLPCPLPFAARAITLGMLAAVAVLGQHSPGAGPAGTVESGLCVRFTRDNGTNSDVAIVENVELYVPAGRPPTPFLPGGGFTATWTGFVTVATRADFQFQAELNGELRLALNNLPALETTGTGASTPAGKPVRVNKGTNMLTAVFRSPSRGDAFLRLSWFNRETPRQPLPSAALTFQTTAEFEHARQTWLGRELFIEFRCARCHAVDDAHPTIAEVTMDGPAFDGIGARRNFAWMTRWILDPRADQPTASMPVLLHDLEARAEARAIAAFLAAQEAGPAKPEPGTSKPTEEQVLAGKKLFDALHCVACHNALDSPDTDPAKVSLKSVRAKFASGALAAFLLKPEAGFEWIRMPRFKFAGDEALQLAAYLDSRGDEPSNEVAPTDAALLERGRGLVQTRGCLNCHRLELANSFKAPSLTSLAAGVWDKGCLAASAPAGSGAPRFGFTPAERGALRAFGATDRASLGRDAPQEFADRQTQRLRCRECHGRFDGFPALDALGGKLKPEWAAQFIAGEIPYNPRPWLDARMPAFPRWAAELAQGLALQHGYPPGTSAEPPLDPAAAAIGRKLVSAAGGFSCVSCHAVGSVPAMQVAESAGINFAYTHQRLLRAYFERWVRQPQQIDPNTKMPVFFDEDDRSPLADVCGGDGAKQREAIWQYLSLGDRMPSPPTQ